MWVAEKVTFQAFTPSQDSLEISDWGMDILSLVSKWVHKHWNITQYTVMSHHCSYRGIFWTFPNWCYSFTMQFHFSGISYSIGRSDLWVLNQRTIFLPNKLIQWGEEEPSGICIKAKWSLLWEQEWVIPPRNIWRYEDSCHFYTSVIQGGKSFQHYCWELDT